jgi:hypothetical protein
LSGDALRGRRPATCIVWLALALGGGAGAQTPVPSPLGSPPNGSGTAWLPRSAPDHMRVRFSPGQPDRWIFTYHGAAFGQMVRNAGIRGHWQLGSTNWLMGAAARAIGNGELRLRAMVSAEPATVSRMGYPQLLQTAAPYRGGLLIDRQHPHELFGELAASYEVALGKRAGISVYIAPSGEPAIGPVAYYHRPSAAHDPLAPLGHHLQEGTHTSFGVITVGGYTTWARFEASTFNGAHPDEIRTGIDLTHARIDSWAARLTVNPAHEWSGSVSAARISNAVHGDATGHAAHALGARERVGATVMHVRQSRSGRWSTTAVYGGDRPAGGGASLGAFLLETDREVGVHAVFARLERVRRTSAELALTGAIPPTVDVSAISAGYARRVLVMRGAGVMVGGRGTINVVPDPLREFYGSFTPLSGLVYVRLSGGGSWSRVPGEHEGHGH